MKTKVITSIIVIVLAGVIWYLYSAVATEKSHISENCPEYKSQQGFGDTAYFIECAGLVGIERWDDEEYPNVYVQTGEEQYSFQVKNYKIQGSEVFFIEDVELNQGYITYHVTVKEQLGMEPADKTELPIYRKLNVDTGEYTLYESIEATPENERSIFEELTI